MRNQAVRAATTGAVILLAIVVALMHALRVPDIRPASAAVDVFAGERAMSQIREISRTPHPIGSAGRDRVRDYLLAELSRIGVPAQVQATTGIGTRYQVAGRVENVVARLPGTQPGPAILLVAHYDAVPASFGAGDDGSGTATILEVLRALRAGSQPRHDVIALFADGEEAGLLGAAAFVREHPWAKDVAVAINVEARGTRGPSLMFETGPGNLDVARMLRGAPGARATSLSTAVYRRLPNDTDLSEIMLLGVPALNFAFIGGVDRYHTSQDDFAHLDGRSVQHHGDQVLALTRAFADGPLPRPATGDAVFFDLPMVGLVVYPERWAIPLAFLALLLAVGGVVLARRNETNQVRAAAVGAVASVVAAATSVVIAAGFAKLLARLHAAVGTGRPDLSGLYVAAAALFAFAVAAASYRIARRWAEPRGLQAGALLAWAALSLLVAVALPGGSFLFTWPTLTVAAAFVVVQLRPGVRPGLALSAVAGVLAIFIIAPIAYLMGSVALGLAQGAPIIAALTTLAAWLLAFALALLGDRSWWPAIVSTAAALLLTVLGVATIRTDADHPSSAAITYAVDADSGGAWLTGSAQTAAARGWLDRELPAMVGGASLTAGPSWLGDFGPRRGVAAPAASPAPATVTIVRDSVADSGRVVRLRVTPAPGVFSIAMRAPGVLAWAVDGRPVDASRFRRRMPVWGMEYVAPPAGGFTLELTLLKGGTPVLELASRQPGLPRVAGLRPPERPAGILPIQRGDVTLTYQRVRL